VTRYRPARRTDVENLAELGARAYRVSSVEKRREFYTDHPRFDLRDVRVAELDGQIAASLVLYPLGAFVRGQRVPLTGVGSVAVAPEHRRRGVARRMLLKVEEGFRRRGVRITRLEVRSVNTGAQDLYLKLGFAVTQRLPRYYSNGGDGLLMIKSLV
jgi:ribosomal protein S18 acetylase RimI-like enzyme